MRKFQSDRSGVAATMYALMAVPLTGAVGFMVDYSNVARVRTQLQNQADAAALVAAMLPPYATDVERSNAAVKLLTNIQGANVNVWTANGYTTVDITQPVKTAMSGIIGIKTLNAGAHAAGMRVTKGPPACVLALNPTVNGAITFGGSSSFTASNCVVFSNSNSSSSISAQGGATVSAPGYCAVGQVSGTLAPTPTTNCQPAFDPFYGLPKPSITGCDYNNMKVAPKKTVNLNPGVYCGGLDIQGRAKLAAGVYIIQDGPLNINSQADASGTGVTFYLTGKGAGFSINGGGSIDLSAPSTGTYAGILIAQDRASNAGTTNTLNGDSNTLLLGSIYTPTQQITVTGSSGFGQNNEFMPLIADQIKISGSAVAKANSTKMPNVVLPTLQNGAKLVY